ncbi:hypothetical protein [Streptomyces youssoufiensis]
MQSRQTLLSLEAGEERTRIPPSLSKLERALGWAPGTAVRILEGEEDYPPAEPKPAPYAEGMPLRVIQELTEGQVLDTEVLDLTRPGSNSRIVVVYKRDSPAADADPEAMRRDIEEWTRVQRAMRQIASGDPSEADEA